MKKVNSLFNEKQRYSIRKYHIGAASIIIGSVVFMNTGSLSYASEVDNKASEIVENEIHTNKERISNIDTAVQEKEDNKANSTIENQNNNPENQKSELKKEVSLVTELPISAPLLEKGNSKNDTQEKEVNKADKQLNDQINSGESPKQVIQENKDNQVEEHSNKNNNQIKDSKTGEVSNYHETELINKEDNLKVDGTDDTNKVVISQNENRQKVRRKRNVVNPSNDNNLTNDDYNKNANQMNTDVSSDGTMTYQWYPVIGGLSSQERFLITNGYGDNENRARKKATMLWLISNFDFTKEQRQSFKIQDLNSPLFGDDVYKWLEEAKKGNIIPKQGTMNLGRRNEMIISANNIILSDNKGFDRGIINFGDTRNFTPSDSDDVNNTTITSSDIDFGFTLKPPFEKIGVDNTWAVSDNEKEEIKSAIRKANSNINFVNINVSYNGTVFAQALNSSGEIVDSADLNANTVIIDKIFIEKKEKLDTLISLVENTKLLDESLYTPASINFLQRELDYTSIVIRDSYDPEINTIPDIISATNRLDYAIKSLVRRANVTELQNAISNAKNQGPFDNNIEEDQAIILALEVGENTVGNENTPQDVVDTVTTNINNALRERLQVKNLLQDVETLVNEAEEKNRNASNMVVTALTDGIFSNNENNTLTELVNSANNKKAEAQDKINLLPDSKKAPFQNRIDSLPTISIPEVNDADGNGIADDVDQAKARAENKVTEAEAADQAAKTKLVEYQQDGLITASEKADLDNLVTTAQSKKTEAQGLVDALPDGLKNDLATRLNNLTGIQVPEVNDADGNGIADDVDQPFQNRIDSLPTISIPEVNDADGNGIADDVDQAKARAENKVTEAEAADQAAKTKLVEYQQDGLITASEKADLDNLVTTAQSKKTEAQGLVDALPDGLKNDLATRLNNLTGIQVPEVNDADGNGIADDVDQAKAQAENKVTEAEAADQAAKTKLTEYQQDGLITASEKADLDSLAATAQSKKTEAQGLVDALPDGLKNDLVTRLNNLTGIQVPAVNDADGNGIADDVDQAKAQAESKVSEAEAADQAAKTKLTEYQQDGLITASEKADLDNLVTTAQSKKTEAQGLVDALPDGLKNDLATRLNNLTGIQVPEVNDADGNGIADDVDQAKAQAENKVTEAEAADQAAKTKLTEYQQDGLITASEKADLDSLAATAQSKKTEAQGLVDALPDGLKNDLVTRLNNLTGIQVPAVNDADGNGIADDVDQAKAQAESKVSEAEAADQAAKTKLTEYQQDGLITASEKADLENLATTAQSKKTEAQGLVDALPDGLKNDLVTRLNNLTGIQVPEVNDADGNGIADDVDQAKAQAESKVSEAEAADQAAKTKLTEYQQDGLITASEKADLENLATTAQSKKTEAQGLVDALPDGLKNDLVTRLNNLTGIQVPAVNDADGNGIADDVDQAKAQAESKVSEAEAADQAAKTKLVEYQQDGLITASEKADLDSLAATAQSKKAEAQGLVDALPDGLKNDLVTRLNNLTGIQVPEVNDADGNGIADDVDQAKARAENKVTEAEAADQAAKTKLVEYQQDGLITASEKADLENLATTAQSKKTEAQGLVDALPDGLKNDLVTRLNNLTGIQVPEVNDADGNGIADDEDQAKAQAESKVSEAEAADQAAKTKLVEYQQDGLITASEKADLENLATTAQSKKTEAQGLVDALSDGLKNDLATRLNNLTGIQVPTVNDADGNGIADDEDQAKAQAESKVSEAEAADQAAKTKLVEYQQDGLITASEKADLDNLVTTAQSKKTEAQGLVDALPDGLKNDLATRLNNLTGIQVPEVNDADGNGIADDVDQAKAQAESKVSEAEAADQAAKTKLTEYQQDGLITASEKADLDSLAATAQSKKAEAQGLVDALPDGLKNDLVTRLNNLTGIQVPAVNDADGNGIADDVDQAKAQAESKVTEAEASYQAAKVKLSEYQQDGLITLTEREEIEELIVLAEKVKREAQKLVDALAESDKGDLSKRLDNLVYIQLPLINDADGNGIADDIDSEILKAENSVINAEVADKTVKDKLTEYQQDGLVSSNEKRELINLLTKAQRAKAEAQVLVDALSSEFRGDLPSRLNKLTGIEIPKVNDADNDGKKDDVDELKALVETKVQEAEAAHQNALAKLSEYQRDGLINQWEKNDILNLSHEVFSKKARAFALVDGLPKEQQDEFLNRLNKLTDLPIPEINDKNNNGIADDVDETKAQAESKVSEAEAANQAAKTKLTEYQQDGLITASEKADLDSLAATAQSKKTEAQGLVDALPDVLKGDLPTRLNNLTGIQVPEVNDADGNGIVDDKDRAQAESKVTEAEAADQVAKTKLSEYQEDGLITEPEKVALENLAATAQTAKTEAQGLVDALPDGLKNDLVTRLNNLTGIQVPEVNDADGNGIADNVDQAKARAENKVTEAEAADQATKTKLTEYQQDGLITASEKADLENLLVTAQSKKAEAQGLVDALPDVLKGDMATRLNNLTGIQVPEVNDADGNGIADDVDQAKARAENKVIEAESIDQTAKAKLVEYQEDGLIIEPEKVDLENLSAMAQSKKAEAQRLVDALSDVLKGDLPTRLNNLTGIQVPEVNDADGNGIADDVDQAKAQAESKVTEAEAADQAAKVKLSEYQQDGLITAPEKTDLENLAAMAQSKKTEAQRLVDALPDVLKGDLSTRLNNLTGIQVPAVNDADGNGIADDIDQAKAQAESKVTEAEAADQAAKTKLSEYQQDGLITASEKADLEKLAAIAQSKKAEAQKLVDAIPNDVKEALQNRLNRLEGIVVPSVSVNSNNGQSNSHNMQGKDDINKNKDTLQKSPALSSNPQKTLNSKADTSNDASNDMKGTHMSTANNESTNTTKLNINSDNTKRDKSNNVKVLSPSKVDEKIDAKTLPNTGEEATKDTTLFGALLASIGSLIVWRSRKKENTKETK